MSDLVNKIRKKFQRNENELREAIELCSYTNRKKRYFEFLHPNLIVVSKQYRDFANIIIKKDCRWILARNTIKHYKFRKDTCDNIPKFTKNVSVVFSALKAQYPGASIRIRFFNWKYKMLSTQTIHISSKCVANCWEFKVPPLACKISVSTRIHSVSDGCCLSKVSKRTIKLRSDITKKGEKEKKKICD